MKCRDCDSIIKDDIARCSYCGYVVNEKLLKYDPSYGMNNLKAKRVKFKESVIDWFYRLVFIIYVLFTVPLFGRHIINTTEIGGMDALKTWLFEDNGMSGIILLTGFSVFLFLFGTDLRDQAAFWFRRIFLIIGAILFLLSLIGV